VNPLRYVHSWPSVVFMCVAIAGVVGIFALAKPDERITILTIFSTLATVGAAVARQAFAVPPPTAPKRIELPRKSDDDDDSDEGGEVLAEEPPTKPLPRTPVRVTLSPRVALAMLPMLLLGCSPSALQTHATTALIARHTLEMTHDAIEVTCTRLAHECADDACLAAREADCTAAGHAQEAAVAAVLTYADAIELAALADEGQVMATLRFALEAAARAWTEAGQRLATIGITIPAIGGL
jgi:hypothetical protein